MPADIMRVDDKVKIDLFQEIMPIVMQYLAANYCGSAPKTGPRIKQANYM
jgi:hypothetical protein